MQWHPYWRGRTARRQQWRLVFALVPHVCQWCGLALWLEWVWRKGLYISNWGGSMWLWDYNCIECKLKGDPRVK